MVVVVEMDAVGGERERKELEDGRERERETLSLCVCVAIELLRATEWRKRGI